MDVERTSYCVYQSLLTFCREAFITYGRACADQAGRGRLPDAVISAAVFVNTSVCVKALPLFSLQETIMSGKEKAYERFDTYLHR